MKNLIILALVLMSLSDAVFGNTVQLAFSKFYNSKEIDPTHCGENIHKFLNYLDQKNISYDHAYVVSIHEPYANLNHFDARWGREETYTNGVEYFRSNWYFHVFAVIDGNAYDFSQAGAKSNKLSTYLIESYLPAYETQNIIFQGVLTRKKTLEQFKKLEMNLYDAKEYKDNFGPSMYTGVFLELFDL